MVKRGRLIVSAAMLALVAASLSGCSLIPAFHPVKSLPNSQSGQGLSGSGGGYGSNSDSGNSGDSNSGGSYDGVNMTFADGPHAPAAVTVYADDDFTDQTGEFSQYSDNGSSSDSGLPGFLITAASDNGHCIAGVDAESGVLEGSSGGYVQGDDRQSSLNILAGFTASVVNGTDPATIDGSPESGQIGWAPSGQADGPTGLADVMSQELSTPGGKHIINAVRAVAADQQYMVFTIACGAGVDAVAQANETMKHVWFGGV